MKKGLYIGRFQPLHKGHLAAILYALEHVEHLIILIGSSQDDLVLHNCFTTAERKKMLIDTLNGEGIDPSTYTLSQVPDVGNNVLWKQSVLDTVEGFDVLFSGNGLVKDLLGDGCEVMDPLGHSGVDLSATIVRQKILDRDDSWENDVPEPVLHIVRGLVDRVRKLSEHSNASSGF